VASTIPLPGKVRRLIDVWRRSGSAPLARLAGDRLVNRIVSATLIDVVLLEQAAGAVAPLQASGAVEARFLGREELRRFAADPANELGPDFVASAAPHHLCFGALAGDRLAAYGWYALGAIGAEHTFGLALSYPDDMAYMYKGFTHPAYRGARLHGVLMAQALRHLAERGIRTLVSLVDWTNTASLRSCERIGYVRLGRLARIQLRGYEFLRVPHRATRLGIRFGAAAQPATRPGTIATGRAA
jgi:ribosomal protein S18 acetylase RimI-like enzyme